VSPRSAFPNEDGSAVPTDCCNAFTRGHGAALFVRRRL